MMNGPARCAIGVDVGGTHTDVQVLWNGRLERGKALTDYADFSRGLLEAIEVAAGKFDVSLRELLQNTETIFNATTVVTNAISEFRGDNVGVLVTAGFKDTFRLSGGPRLAAFDGLARVVSIGSFSKTLSAAVRCGYIAARSEWIEPLVDLKLATTFGNGQLAASVVHRLLVDGTYRRHL